MTLGIEAQNPGYKTYNPEALILRQYMGKVILLQALSTNKVARSIVGSFSVDPRL